MALSDRGSPDVSKESPSEAQDSPSSASRTTPSRPPPPKVHYSLPKARNDPPKEGETLIHQPPEFDEEDGMVYKTTTTTGLRNGDSRKVLDKLQQIHQSSSGTVDFLRNFRVYMGSLGAPWFWILIFSLLCIYAFAMIIVGSVNMKKCSIQPMIPVYLVVAGVLFLIKLSFKIYEELLDANKQPVVRQSLQGEIWWRIISALLTMFLFAWFIAGCIWVYGAHHVEFHLNGGGDHSLRCQKDLYIFAFWTITLQIIILAAGLIGTFLLITCLTITAEKNSRTLN